MRHASLGTLAVLALAACSGDSSAPTAYNNANRSTIATAAAANGTNIVVAESDITRQPEDSPPTDNWVLYARNAGTGVFVSGPGTPPLGTGSLLLTTPTGADKVTLFNYDYVGTPIADVRSMGYSTFRVSGSEQQVAAINIQVDVNGAAAGGFTTLVFEPVYNTAQGAVASGTWQTWDAYNGGNAIWWSSSPIPGAPNRDTFVTWNSIVAANPNAVILGYGVNQGSGNPALITAVDALHFDTPQVNVTYDFEPFRVASGKDACKDDGWKTVKRADGSGFKNQGDCVSYTQNGK
jgi:hypothetical protein